MAQWQALAHGNSGQAGNRSKEKDSAIGWRGEYIIRMSAFQPLALMRNRDMTADQYGLDEGRMINGQEILIQIIT